MGRPLFSPLFDAPQAVELEQRDAFVPTIL
jgi:hypothetical protein